jgi:molybdopterin converting factor small subunit
MAVVADRRGLLFQGLTDKHVKHTGRVTVEFYGVPRVRAGRAEAATVADSLAAVEQACPGLIGLVQANGRLAPHFLLSLNGTQFVTDPDQPVHPGDRLLLLSADAGG